MKLKAPFAALVLAGVTCGFAGSAFAQSCSAGPFQGSIATGAPPAGVSGNNCNNNLNFTKICANSETLGGGGMDIYQMTVGASNSFTISINSSAFTPELGFIATNCASNTTCIVDQTIAAPGTVTSSTLSGLAPGTYYIFVANVADGNCGAYNLSFTGNTPVKLQNFSIQ
jgi:hypothetical protein